MVIDRVENTEPPASLHGNYSYERKLPIGSATVPVAGSYSYEGYASKIDLVLLQELLTKGTQGLEESSTPIQKGKRAKSVLKLGNEKAVLYWGPPSSQVVEQKKAVILSEQLEKMSDSDILIVISLMSGTKDAPIIDRLQKVDFVNRVSIKSPNVLGVLQIVENERKLTYPFYEYIEGKDGDEAEESVLSFFENEISWQDFEAFLDYLIIFLRTQGIDQKDFKPENLMFSIKDNKLNIVFTDFESITLKEYPELDQDLEDHRRN
jgi:hypothetical protein